MKPATPVIVILMISVISLAGCSGDTASEDPGNKTVIKTPITMPVTEEKASSPEGETPVIGKEIAAVPLQVPGSKTKDAPPVSEAKETAPDADSVKATGAAKTVEDGKTDDTTKAAATAPEDKKVKEKKETGAYVTKGNEGLSEIASRKEVYGDPLKWILLYRYNREALGNIQKDETFSEKALPVGINLKIVVPDDATPEAEKRWVVNALSFPEEKRIVKEAVTLVDSGYHVYITRATVKGQEYFRLRVGFFNGRTEAEDDGKRIIAILNVTDLWTTKADRQEYKEFAGYK